MSKTETVKALRDSGTDQQIEILRSIRDLQSEMRELPEALADQLTERLAPLEALTKAQRQAMDAAMRETVTALAAIKKEELPRRITVAAAALDRAAQRQPGPAIRILELALAAVIGGLVVMGGTLALSAIQQPSGPQQVMEQRQ